MHRKPSMNLRLRTVWTGWAVLAGLFAIGGCVTSSKSRVIRRENGRLEALARADRQAEAVLSAVDQASKFCEDKKQNAIFPDESFEEARKSDNGEVATSILRKIPGIGRVLNLDHEEQVFIPFRCG